MTLEAFEEFVSFYDDTDFFGELTNEELLVAVQESSMAVEELGSGDENELQLLTLTEKNEKQNPRRNTWPRGRVRAIRVLEKAHALIKCTCKGGIRKIARQKTESITRRICWARDGEKER